MSLIDSTCPMFGQFDDAVCSGFQLQILVKDRVRVFILNPGIVGCRVRNVGEFGRHGADGPGRFPGFTGPVPDYARVFVDYV